MSWDDLIPLIAKYGVEWVFEFWKIVSTSTTPTPEQWAALVAMSQKSLADYVKDAQAAADAQPPPPASPS